MTQEKKEDQESRNFFAKYQRVFYWLIWCSLSFVVCFYIYLISVDTETYSSSNGVLEIALEGSGGWELKVEDAQNVQLTEVTSLDFFRVINTEKTFKKDAESQGYSLDDMDVSFQLNVTEAESELLLPNFYLTSSLKSTVIFVATEESNQDVVVTVLPAPQRKAFVLTILALVMFASSAVSGVLLFILKPL